MICTNCKKEIGENVKFCPECGEKIELQSEDKNDNETVPKTDANQGEVIAEESLETKTDVSERTMPKKQKVLEGKFEDKKGRRVTLWRPKSSCTITMYIICALIAIACLILFGVFKYNEFKYKHSQEYFHKAVEKGDVNTVKKLIEYGINVNQVKEIDDYFGEEDPLSRAVRNDNVEIVKLLLAAGANPNCAISWAVRAGNLPIVKLLVEAGADVNRFEGDYYPTVEVNYPTVGKIFRTVPLLFIASYSGEASIVKCLIENGANVNSKADQYLWKVNKSETNGKARDNEIPDTQYGEWIFDCVWTPLMIASANNHIDVVKVLLDNDAGLMTRNNYGNTAIDLARIYDAQDALNILLRYRRKIYGY